MMNPNTQRLQELMQQVNISSFKELTRLAEISEWQVRQLRRGNIAKMRVENLQKLAKVLQVSLPEFIACFSANLVAEQNSREELQRECDRLQKQLEEQREILLEQFQRESLQVLESWLLQWPSVKVAVEKNPQLPARRALPLVKPVEALMEQWQIEAIASVGEEIPYDPQWHQLMAGTAQEGDLVRVRYTGYRFRGKLLYRARVSAE